MDILKENAISSDKGWKSAGRPRSGPLFTKRNSDKRTYRIAIRKRQSDATSAFTNDLNDALLSKRGKDFWKCWNAKFERNSPLSSSIDGVTDQVEIVHNFAEYFKLACTNLTLSGSENRRIQYESMRRDYCGYATDDWHFNAELIDDIICDLKFGKASDIDRISAEHLR